MSTAMKNAQIPARYTCDGRDISPPLEWGTVPPGVGSLALFVVGLTPEPSTSTDALSIEYAVAGINPALHRLAAGTLPRGSYLGHGLHGLHYSICPTKGVQVEYEFELYGLSANERIAPDFGALQVLQELNATKAAAARAHGSFTASYQRQ